MSHKTSLGSFGLEPNVNQQELTQDEVMAVKATFNSRSTNDIR